MYIQQVPTYNYYLPCGHRFRSQFPSQPDEMGVHHFSCDQCERVYAVLGEALDERVPTCSNGRFGRRLSDKQVVIRLDDALRRDRALQLLRDSGGYLTAEEIAKEAGLCARTVKRIGLDQGIYLPNEPSDPDPDAEPPHGDEPEVHASTHNNPGQAHYMNGDAVCDGCGERVPLRHIFRDLCRNCRRRGARVTSILTTDRVEEKVS